MTDDELRVDEEVTNRAILVEALRRGLGEAVDLIAERMPQEIGYGYFPGGDPRNFTPDPECCTQAEWDKWEADCQRVEKGEEPTTKTGDDWHPVGEGPTELPAGADVGTAMNGRFIHVQWGGYGVGTYTMEDQEIAQVRAMLGEVLRFLDEIV